MNTLMICGMAGYENNTDYSVERHLRDLFSAPLMISNDRNQLNTANLLLARRTPATGSIQDMNALTERAAIAAAYVQLVSTYNASDITLRGRLIEAGMLIDTGESGLNGLDVNAWHADAREFQSDKTQSSISAGPGVLS